MADPMDSLLLEALYFAKVNDNTTNSFHNSIYYSS